MTIKSPILPLQDNAHLGIFTDLDGTLLDRRYSWKPAADCLEELRRRKIPVVICTSKTQAEVEQYRRETGIVDPFIVENGGAIFIPQGYFAHLPLTTKMAGDYHIIESNIPYANLLAALGEIKRKISPQTLGFSDMSSEQLSEISGLSLQQAILAKNRKYDEPFLIPGNEHSIEEISLIVEGMGLKYIRGTRFQHICGAHDKGTAARKLKAIYRLNDADFFAVGLGDSPIDIPFLEQMDLPIVVQEEGGKYHPALDCLAYLKAPAAGPTGWSIAVSRFLEATTYRKYIPGNNLQEKCNP